MLHHDALKSAPLPHPGIDLKIDFHPFAWVNSERPRRGASMLALTVRQIQHILARRQLGAKLPRRPRGDARAFRASIATANDERIICIIGGADFFWSAVLGQLHFLQGNNFEMSLDHPDVIGSSTRRECEGDRVENKSPDEQGPPLRARQIRSARSEVGQVLRKRQLPGASPMRRGVKDARARIDGQTRDFYHG